MYKDVYKIFIYDVGKLKLTQYLITEYGQTNYIMVILLNEMNQFNVSKTFIDLENTYDIKLNENYCIYRIIRIL